jgi:hypothetical protein
VKKIIIVVGLVVLLGLSFVLYKWLAPREQADPFTIVPEDAVLVLETSQLYNAWEEFQDKKVWHSLKQIPAISSLQYKINAFDSLLVMEDKREFFKDKKVLISLHVSSSKECDYLFYIPVNSSKEENFLKKALEKLQNNKEYMIESKTYHDYNIQSIHTKDNSQSISYFVYKNYFIAGFSNKLVEGVIDRLENKKTNFLFWKKERSDIKKLVEGKTSLYLRYDKIKDLLSMFSGVEFLKPLASFADKSVLEVRIDDRELLLNGFTYSTSEEKSFIQCFRTQKPQKFNLKNYIPNSTSSVYYYGYSDGVSLRKSLENYWSAQDPNYLKSVDSLNKEFKINVGSLYKNFKNEIGLCHLDSETSPGDKLIFVYSENSEKLIEDLNKISEATSKGGRLIDNETWQRKKIREIKTEEFPAKVFGKIFSGFPQCYYTSIDNYVVFSNNKQNIKNLFKDIETDNVWGKTILVNSFLEETITEFNVGVFVNISNSWKSLLNEVSPEFKDQLINNEKFVQGFDLLALQFSHINETILTNMVVTHDLSVPDYSGQPSNQLVWDAKLKSEIYLIESKNRGKDFLVQDSLNNIYLVGNDLKVKWKYSLGESIQGGVTAIDIHKDKNWEVVLAAANKIYAFNYKGKMVNKFPIVISDTIKTLSILDYDNTKDYRISVSDKSGQIYFYNTAGQNLEGWTPKEVSGNVFDKVRHLRIANKDYILAIQENGTISLMNRKGEMQNPFPLKLKKGQVISYVQQKGKDLEDTEFIVQHADKSFTTFNLEGKILQQTEAREFLIPDSRRQSFVWFKPELQRSTVTYDQENQLKIPFRVTNIKYFNFSSKGEFVMAFDKSGKGLSVYNNKGQEVLKHLDSEGFSDLYYDEKGKAFKFYNLYNNKISLVEF